MTGKATTIYYTLAVVFFFVAAFFIITYATGYKVDITNKNISKTGIIVVEAESEANVEIDDKSLSNGKLVLRDLTPKNYSVKISRDGYHEWTRNIELLPGEAEIIDDAILFKSDIKPEEYNYKDAEFLKKMADADGLSVENNEIYQNGNFVTRLTKEVQGVSWYSDRRYISYTYEDKFHIIEIDGTNDIALFDKKSASPAIFINSGRSVIYENEGKIYKADIK